MPVAGSPVKALSAGSRAGLEAVAAGRIMARTADNFLPNAGASVGHDLRPIHDGAIASDEALLEARHHLDEARRLLAGPAGALLPPVSAPAKDFLGKLDRVSKKLEKTERAMVLTSEVTAPGADVRLLVLSQDTMELRPTGGLIGSYGVLRIVDGHAEMEEFADIFDIPFPKPAMPPPAGFPDVWTMNNANWSPDFPTTARTASEMFARGGQGHVDGVLALTEHTMGRLLGALGPIQLPGYSKPVTQEGFAERVLYEIELKRPHDKPRKKFLIDLAGAMFERLFQVHAEQVPGVLDALGDSAGEGDVHLWFENPKWQGLLAGTAVEGALPAPTGDHLQLAEANMTPSKANMGLTRALRYEVKKAGKGRLAAKLTIRYRNDAPKSEVNPYYNGLIRLYVPKGVELIGPEGSLSDAPEGPYSVITRSVFVEPDGGERTVVFDYLLPKRIDKGGYRLEWVRHPGTPRDTYTAVIDGTTHTLEADDRQLVID
jgi:uncharacterized protein DUF4012